MRGSRTDRPLAGHDADPVLDVVGLTPALLAHAPHLQALRAGAMRPLTTVLPAVTTTVQSTMLTGALPREHGIVANGWYFRDLSEIWLWRQSNQLVGGEKVWDAARRRDPTFTCAKLFWWYNMYADVDFAVTPRPMYLADGRKLPDIHTHPAALRDELQGEPRPVPAVPLLGPGRRHRVEPLDRRERAACARAAAPDADARVPAASRLRPAAPGPEPSGHPGAGRGGRCACASR